MHLYEIAEELSSIQRKIEEAGGEIADSDLEEFSGLNMSFADKIENCAKMVRNWEAESDALRAEAKRLSDRARAADGRCDRLKAYMLNNMAAVGSSKVQGSILGARIQKNPPAVDVPDPAAIPAKYRREVVEVVVDKKAILADWKATGEDIPGATIRQGEGLRIF